MSDNDKHAHVYAHPTLNEQHVFLLHSNMDFEFYKCFVKFPDVSPLPAIRNLAGMVWIAWQRFWNV